MAADVQQRMIPHTPPEVPGVELASVYVPCYELGGDFFDFIPLPDDNIGLADRRCQRQRRAREPDHGLRPRVSAGAGGQRLLPVRSDAADQPDALPAIPRSANLSRSSTACSTPARAGSPTATPAIRRRSFCATGKVIELASDNMVLGVNAEEEYSQSFIDLQKGDLLLLYTDGVTDAMNFGGERFGRQRIIDTFKAGGASKAGRRAPTMSLSIFYGKSASLWDWCAGRMISR